ncbi:MAG: LysE family transporter [Actinomycetota bacterium]
MLRDLSVFLIAGLGVGVATATVPGPIVILLIAETLKYGWRAGAAVAAAPVIVDALIMVPLALVLQSLMNSREILTVFGLASAVFLVYLGLTMILNVRRDRLEGFEREKSGEAPIRPLASFRKALVTHLLSPFAYGFWGTVGAYWLHRSANYLYIMGWRGLSGIFLTPLTFGLGFWLGTLSVAAALIAASVVGRKVFSSAMYRGFLLACGLAMVAFGIYTAARVMVV